MVLVVADSITGSPSRSMALVGNLAAVGRCCLNRAAGLLGCLLGFLGMFEIPMPGHPDAKRVAKRLDERYSVHFSAFRRVRKST